MKSTSIILLFILISFTNMACAQQKNPCPPYHQEFKTTFKEFLKEKVGGDDVPQKLQRLGLDGLSIDDVQYLKKVKDVEVCQRLKKDFPWPIDHSKHRYRSYYKSKNHYFIINVLIKQPAPKGMINLNSGYDVITILNKDYKVLDSELF